MVLIKGSTSACVLSGGQAGQKAKSCNCGDASGHGGSPELVTTLGIVVLRVVSVDEPIPDLDQSQRKNLPFEQPIRLFAHQGAAQVVHGQQQLVGDGLQLFFGGFALRPLRGQVHVIHRAVDIVDVAAGQHVQPFHHPAADDLLITLRQGAVALRFDLSVADVQHRDLVHFDTTLAIFCIYAEHRRAVVTYPEIILW